ncbi:MAG: glycosyltransferase [Lachnospiraceae bacterium]|nr:glycosyltransferase [Lachnospiraceae bacterium]
MEQPKVSIIVPVYKVPENYLRKCIESIMVQTLKDIEILLVDDGSPDNCGEICDSYASKDSRIRVLHKKNGGLSSARNAGFFAATSKWIMFVDGDDWIEPDMCDYMYREGEKNDVQLVMCGIMKDYGKTSVEYKFYLEDHKVYASEECKWLQQQLLVYNGNIAVAYSKLIERELLQKNNILHDEVLRQGAEGLEFNLRLFEKLERAEFVNKPFYHYIYNESSISAAPTEENNEYVLKCFGKINEFIESSDNREMLEPWFDNRLLYVIITTAISGYFNPGNVDSYKTRKAKFSQYLKKPIIQVALKSDNLAGLSSQRKVTLFLIKHNAFLVLNLMGKVRKWQKTQK